MNNISILILFFTVFIIILWFGQTFIIQHRKKKDIKWFDDNFYEISRELKSVYIYINENSSDYGKTYKIVVKFEIPHQFEPERDDVPKMDIIKFVKDIRHKPYTEECIKLLKRVEEHKPYKIFRD